MLHLETFINILCIILPLLILKNLLRRRPPVLGGIQVGNTDVKDVVVAVVPKAVHNFFDSCIVIKIFGLSG